ncbi:MAG: PASTA domain-containing protein [Dethiobacteria bacterium]
MEVPDLIERAEHEARLILKDAGLEMSLSHEYSDTVTSGHIIRQDPGKDFQVARGETVRVVVSKGKKPVTMRNFQGRLLADAQEWLDHNGLVLRDPKEEYSAEFAPGEIISQFPAAGETVQAGDPVDLVISKGKEPEAVQTYHIKVSPRVPAGRLIKIYVEDEEGSKLAFEGEYQGQEISVAGVGCGPGYLNGV